MHYTSRHWDEANGSCLLHGHPEVPCRQCLAEHQTDVRLVLTYSDRQMAAMSDISILDLLPANGEWLLDRIV